MGSVSDDEEVLGQEYLKKINLPDTPEPNIINQQIEKTVQRANLQTGAKDLIVLAISSCFVLLLLIFSPIATSSLNKKKD